MKTTNFKEVIAINGSVIDAYQEIVRQAKVERGLKRSKGILRTNGYRVFTPSVQSKTGLNIFEKELLHSMKKGECIGYEITDKDIVEEYKIRLKDKNQSNKRIFVFVGIASNL